ISAGDFNQDGNIDLAVANSEFGIGDVVAILLGNGNGTFQNGVSYPLGNGTPSPPLVADFNRDGKLDIAVGDCNSYVNCDSYVQVLLGNGDGTFQPPIGSVNQS